MTSDRHAHSARATALGLAAIVLWSTTVAVFRSLAEQLDVFSAGALAYLSAGAIGCGVLVARGRLVPFLRGASVKYLLGCGFLMTAHTMLLFSAIGFAETRAQVVVATVANYLWPALTLLCSVLVLGFKARPAGLALGTIAGIGGVVIAVCSDATGFHGELFTGSSGVTALVAAGGAVCWALYSVVGRRWGADSGDGGMPLFLLAAGLVLLGARFVHGEHSHFSGRVFLEAGYMIVFPTLLAYVCWDVAARRGNLALIAAGSYLTPLLSIGVTWLYLDVPVASMQWVGAGCPCGPTRAH
jgi:drug/metabolite transporter (DMT)-like permease